MSEKENQDNIKKENEANKDSHTSDKQESLPSSKTPFQENELAPFASGFPAFGAVKAIFAARKDWPKEPYSNQSLYVIDMKGRKLQGRIVYYILLPWDATTEEVTIAHNELACNILKSLGPDTAWLHILLLAYAVAPERRGLRTKEFCIPREEIYRCLKLDKRTDLTRKEKDQRVIAEIKQLSSIGLQITQLQWIGEKKRRGKIGTEFKFDKRLAHLWEVSIHEFGRYRYEIDENGKKIKKYENWQLVGREGLWGETFLHSESLRQFGYLVWNMLEKVDRYHCPWGAALALKLTFESRFKPEEKLSVNTREIIEFAGGIEYPSDRKDRYDTRLKVLEAIEEQRKWGWQIDYSQWPQYLQPSQQALIEEKLPSGYWDIFLHCVTLFSPPAELLKANLQAKHIPVLAEKIAKPIAIDMSSNSQTEVTSSSQAEVTSQIPKKKDWGRNEIKELREKLKWTQRKFATAMGISATLVNYLENGKRVVRPEHKKKLSQIEQTLLPTL